MLSPLHLRLGRVFCSSLRRPANRNAREWSRALRLSLYFECSELDGAKRQVSLKKFLCRFQIETGQDCAAHRSLHCGYLAVLNSRNLTYFFSPLLGTDFRLFALLRRGFRMDWIWCALTTAAIRPGKRRSISVHREVLCISTPLRSPRISPASRRTLKCCESVDFGMSFSVTFKKFEQLREHSDPTISEKIATRIGSLSA